MSEIDVTKCTRYCADNGKCTAFKGIYLCSERANCYIKRIIKKQMIIDKLNKQLHRYKQVVKGIKEIIKFNKTNRLSGGACISIEQILQICEEVK